MPNRKLRSVFGAVVFLVVTAQVAAASPPPAKKPAEAAAPTTTTPNKAKAGEACKTHADCDQSSAPLSCQKAKCEVDHSRTPPPT